MFGKKFKNPEINRLIAEEQAEQQKNKVQPTTRGESKSQCLAPTKTMNTDEGRSNAKPTQFLASKKAEDKE